VRRLALVAGLAAGAAASLSIGACLPFHNDPPPSTECTSGLPIAAGNYAPLHALPDGGAIGDDYQLTISSDQMTVEERFVRDGHHYRLVYSAVGTSYGRY
jgi:hypothetical protein